MDRRPETLVHARALRKAMTRSEVALWQAVRGPGVAGRRFRRQHPFGPYVLDFYCPIAKLAVEVDGPVHEDERQAAADAIRDAYLLRHGVRTMRVTSAEVLGDVGLVVERIRQRLRERGLA